MIGQSYLQNQKSKLECTESVILEQKHVNDEKLNELKVLKESAKQTENQAADFRNLKKEKKTLAASQIENSTVEDKNGTLKSETKNLNNENKKLIDVKKMLVSEVLKKA